MIFISKLSTAVAFLLLLSFILQPIERVRAAEESLPSDTATPPEGATDSVSVAESVEVSSGPPAAPEVTEPLSDVPSEPVIPVATETETAAAIVSAEPLVPITAEVPSDTSSMPELLEAATTTPVSDESSFEPPIAEVEVPSDAAPVIVVDAETTVDDGIESVPTPEITSDPEVVSAAERAELSLPLVATSTESSFVQSDENFYQFSRTACVKAGSGTFHCSDVSSANTADSPTAVSAALGTSGSQEIFITTSSGASKQLTDNQYDDTAPQYDPDSERIVWQRLIDGRQQIILYDVASKAETQLTQTSTNNMEPALGGSFVVWQVWDHEDWEIMMYDGEKTTQITDNTAEDVTPVTKDGYVMWTVIGQDEQLARVYSIETGETYTISDHEGGAIVNPRFVLVYDTKFENGDVTTHGFDPLTGLSSPITATPAPIEIPDSDSTGETRALIQIKSQLREDAESEDGGGPNPVTGLSTTTDLMPEVASSTLDLQSAQFSDGAGQAEIGSVSAEIIPLSDYDLVVMPFSSSTAVSTQP